MTREQFDELMDFIASLRKVNRLLGAINMLDEFEKKLKQIFPEFTEPKFRKCVVCEVHYDAPSGGTYEEIDTSPLQIVADEDGFYITGGDHVYAFFYVNRNVEILDELSVIDKAKAQAIKKFFSEGGHPEVENAEIIAFKKGAPEGYEEVAEACKKHYEDLTG